MIELKRSVCGRSTQEQMHTYNQGYFVYLMAWKIEKGIKTWNKG